MAAFPGHATLAGKSVVVLQCCVTTRPPENPYCQSGPCYRPYIRTRDRSGCPSKRCCKLKAAALFARACQLLLGNLCNSVDQCRSITRVEVTWSPSQIATSIQPFDSRQLLGCIQDSPSTSLLIQHSHLHGRRFLPRILAIVRLPDPVLLWHFEDERTCKSAAWKLAHLPVPWQ